MAKIRMVEILNLKINEQMYEGQFLIVRWIVSIAKYQIDEKFQHFTIRAFEF